MLQLKQVVYDPASSATVVYLIHGREVYFSGITQPASTENWAEQIVLAITRAESLLWEMCTFYDFHTHRGYAHHEPGSFHLDQLAVVNRAGKPSVESWREVACRNWNGRTKPITETTVPMEVYMTFVPYIFSEAGSA